MSIITISTHAETRININLYARTNNVLVNQKKRIYHFEILEFSLALEIKVRITFIHI